MPIVQAASVNTTALIVPDVYTVIVPPQQLLINGVPTNVLGVVGTANWGPVNTAAVIGSMVDYSRTFGPLQNRSMDMGTVVATATLQGASNFRCVRVTDGTDTAATGVLVASCLTLTAAYTGTFGNSIAIAVGTGSKVGSFKLTVGAPGMLPEVFDNITGTGNAFWLNAAAAINNGNNIVRGPSQLVVATAGAGTTAPAAGTTITLAGGADGVSSVTAATLVGVDANRTGMYALRGQGASVGVLADATDPTTFGTQAGFGISEGILMICQLAPSMNVATAVSTKGTAGLDSYAAVCLHGDYVYYNDPVNQVVRLVTPQGFYAGRLANLAPQNSPLNKPIYGVASTQKSGAPGSLQSASYSNAELQLLGQAGIDVISTPAPGGAYFAARFGHNSSSNPAINTVPYSRMTNYIADTINAGIGLFVGNTINVTLFQQVAATINAYFQALMNQGMIGSTDGTLPWSVICSAANNPQSRTALGYLQVDCQVRYLGVVEKLIVNVEGGSTVSINRSTTPV